MELKSRTPDNVTFTTSGSHKTNGAADASVQAECDPFRGATVKGKIDTAGVTSTTLELQNHFLEGLKLTAAAATPPIGSSALIASATLGVDYSAGMFSLAAGVDPFKGAASSSAVTSLGLSQGKFLKGGCTAAYDLNKSALKAFGAKVSFVDGTYAITAGVKGDSKLALEYGLSYYHDISIGMQLATEMAVDSSNKVSIAAGSSWRIDPHTSVKAKVDTTGTLGLSYKHVLNNITTVTLAGSFDLNLDPTKTKTGVVLNINPR